MYSKNVGDYDVRIKDDKIDEEYTWDISYRQPQKFEIGFQTDLFDTKRHVGYIDKELKLEDDDAIEEQRQEIITFRLPLEKRITEEIHETTITTEIKQNNRQIEEIHTQSKPENFDRTIIKSETNEWTRSLGGNTGVKTTIKKRSNSPEELVEEAYEIVSTLTKAQGGNKSVDIVTNKIPSSEDDNSYCEEWTVTEAKCKQDGQTIKTIIDR